MSVHTLVDNN